MFNYFKKIIGSKELKKEEVGHYFHYGSCSFGENDDFNIIDSKNIETIFYLNTYATNSMKLIIESIKGKKEYHLERFPEKDSTIRLKVVDFDSSDIKLNVTIYKDIAIFKLPNENEGFYFSKEYLIKKEVVSDSKTLDLNNKKVDLLKSTIRRLIKSNIYIATKFKEEFNEDLDKMLIYIVSQKDIDKYNWFFKTCGNDKAQKLLYDELDDYEIKSLPINDKEIEHFKKLQQRVFHNSFMAGVIDKNGKTLLEYMIEYKILNE